MMQRLIDHPDVSRLVDVYIERLAIPTEALRITDSRAVYAGWLGRPVPSNYGGAYCFHPRNRSHDILINVNRIDTSKPKSIEIVVCEEFVHMRDWLDGDRRRHAHHGHDRIALRVAELTGADLAEVRNCLRPVRRRPLRYLYRCPACGMEVRRRVQGTWSCGRCAPRFRRDLVLTLVDESAAD